MVRYTNTWVNIFKIINSNRDKINKKHVKNNICPSTSKFGTWEIRKNISLAWKQYKFSLRIVDIINNSLVYIELFG